MVGQGGPVQAVSPRGLQDCLNQVERLNIFPTAALKILELSRSPNALLDQLEEAVALDPVLAARVLKVANAPLFGLRVRIGTLRRALQMLGFDGARNIAISLALRGISDGGSEWGERLWRHCEATGWICRVLSRRTRNVNADEMFVAGLLHDLGLQLLLILEPGVSTELLEVHGPDDPELILAETRHMGFHHGQLGAECLRRWKLPPYVVQLVEQHHLHPLHPLQPSTSARPAQPRLLALLQLADTLADPLLEGADQGTLEQLALHHPAEDDLRIARGAMRATLELLIKHRGGIVPGASGSAQG
ncbi:MAG TPA: HDOD domain-containing protein [Deltaproteobacteria bacterium]|nr:HDOD domain-containing protein [Deltaproteobacteria bacterium]